MDKASGPTKFTRLVEFLRTTLLAMVKRAESDGRAREAAALAKASTAESKLVVAGAEVAKLRAVAGTEEGRVPAMARQLEAAHTRREQELAQVRREMAAAAGSASAEVAKLRQAASVAELTAASAASALEVAKARAESAERQLAAERAAGAGEKSARTDLEAALRGVAAEKEELRERVRYAFLPLLCTSSQARRLQPTGCPAGSHPLVAPPHTARTGCVSVPTIAACVLSGAL